jgi:tetrahydromethanopterin S-methyltransferase subunit G
MNIKKLKFFPKGKSAFLVRDFVIVGIIFGLVIALYVILVASTANQYNNTEIISPSFAAHYSNLNSNLAKINTANEAVQGSGGLNLIGTFNVAFNSVFTVIAMVWDTITIYKDMGSNISRDFNFLDQKTVLLFLGAVIAMLTVYLVFIWLSSVSRGKL